MNRGKEKGKEIKSAYVCVMGKTGSRQRKKKKKKKKKNPIEYCQGALVSVLCGMAAPPHSSWPHNTRVFPSFKRELTLTDCLVVCLGQDSSRLFLSFFLTKGKRK